MSHPNNIKELVGSQYKNVEKHCYNGRFNISLFYSKKPTAKETVIKQSPLSIEAQKNEYRKVKIKISKAYHYKTSKTVESDQEAEKDTHLETVPEVTTLTPTRIVTPPSTVIVIDSPPPETVPNSKPYYESDVKPQSIITRYSPPASSILENILLRNRTDTNNNDNNQRQPNATPPPSSPTEMAYSYKKSHRYGTVPCSPDSSSNLPVQNILPPTSTILKSHPPSPIPPTTIYMAHSGDTYPSHLHQNNYYNIYSSQNGIVHSTIITSAPTNSYSPPITSSFSTSPHANTANLIIPTSHIISSNISHHLLTPLTPLQHTNGRPSPPGARSPENCSSLSPTSPNGQASRGKYCKLNN